MKVVGFNFNKISAQREKNLKRCQVTTNLEFLDLHKEKVEAVNQELINMDFKFNIVYKENAEKNAKALANVLFEGSMLLSTDKNESKTLLDSWKKKEVPQNMKIPLLNLVLKKCSVKALALEEELSLPSHLPLPKLSISPKK